MTDARYPLLVGAAITGLAMSSSELDTRANEEFFEDKPLGSYSKAGDILGQLIPNIAYTAWMIGDDAIMKSPSSSRRAHHMIRATFHSVFLSTILKVSVREDRPDHDHSRTSFPSGHTVTTFAFATVVASEHEWYWGLAAYGLATFVGASRVNDRRHRWDDVLAGATIGVSYGLGVFYNMTDSSSSSSDARVSGRRNNFAVVPIDGLRGTALAFRLEY